MTTEFVNLNAPSLELTPDEILVLAQKNEHLEIPFTMDEETEGTATEAIPTIH